MKWLSLLFQTLRKNVIMIQVKNKKIIINKIYFYFAHILLLFVFHSFLFVLNFSIFFVVFVKFDIYRKLQRSFLLEEENLMKNGKNLKRMRSFISKN